MCTVSMVAQDWTQRWPQRFPQFEFLITEPFEPNKMQQFIQGATPITRKEFDELKKELAAIKELLKAAKKYDAATGQPDCEEEEKIRLFKRLAELVGIDFSEVFTAAKPSTSRLFMKQ